MKTIASPLKFYLAALISTLVFIWPTVLWATLVSFEFEGPATSVAEGTYVTGKVTYDTTAPRIDIRGPFDIGDSFLYTGAITSFSFMTETVSGAYSGGDIQLWNDYERCLHVTSTGCLNYQTELERLHFQIDDFADVISSSVSLILLGEDQSFLSSGNLPEMVPTEGYFRTDFFWEYVSVDEDLLIASNDIQVIPQAIPEPGKLLLLCIGLLALCISSWLRSTSRFFEILPT